MRNEGRTSPAASATARRTVLDDGHQRCRVCEPAQLYQLKAFDTSAGHPTTEAEIQGPQAYGGLDVGAVSDLTPLVWVVPCPHIEGAWDVLVRVFLPEAALTNSRKADLYRS